MSAGAAHTACISDTGQVITFGRNAEGQLGRGHARAGGLPAPVPAMKGRVAGLVQCGASFTVCGTVDNVLHFWGTRNVGKSIRKKRFLLKGTK